MSVTPNSEGYYDVSGYLTLCNVTKPVAFKMKMSIEKEGYLLGESNVFQIDRTKWGINTGSKNIFKKITENIISDEFNVSIKVIAK